MNSLSLLKEVKENNQDYEWYPTTNEIIEKIYEDLMYDENIDNFSSILDIGIGNGKFFTVLDELNSTERMKTQEYRDNDSVSWDSIQKIEHFRVKKYGIEKSKVLVDSLDKDIFVIGSDFHNQSLLDKDMDITFCNPPYSEFIEWTVKILKETNSKHIYLVIPTRWKDSKEILSVIEKRNIKYTVIHSSNFIHAEDRQARAKVDVIRFDIIQGYGCTSSFDLWFDEYFSISADVEDTSKYEKEQSKKNTIENSLISKENIITELVSMYNKELEKLLSNYKALENLDGALLKELGVTLTGVKEGLKNKIANLKNIYWDILFNRLDSVTTRLTKKSRESFTTKLFQNTRIDFTEDNILTLLIWIVKNSNDYFDTQLIEVYKNIANKETIQLYKSNKVIIKDDWRYIRDEVSHYSLDYRIIIHCYNNFSNSSYDGINGLSRTTYDTIKDILTIGKNLNFDIDFSSLDTIHWEAGKQRTVYLNSGDNFMEVRPYLNGNIHIKLDQKFMKKFNIEASRLLGWIKSPQEAQTEMGIDIEECEEFFNSNIHYGNAVKLLT